MLHLKKNSALFILFLIVTSQHSYTKSSTPHKLSFIGTGYVGLVTGACLAECGHYVICADIDEKKIKNLNDGILPIYEPNLDTLVSKNHACKRLSFTTDLKKSIQESDVIFIAVGTPFNEKTGEIDLTYVFNVIAQIAEYINGYKIIVVKSTVPVGTEAHIHSLLVGKYNVSPEMFDVVSNPEFLREGTAVYDTFHPDRIVIGAKSEKAHTILQHIYEPLAPKNVPFILTDSATAEMIKYASNSFLATKVAFINEIANICRATGSNVTTVSKGMGLDPRIGAHFLRPGPGFGGSCLPKDTRGLAALAKKLHVAVPLLQSVITSNDLQQAKAFELVQDAIGSDLPYKTITILGLAFKAETDDIRFTPAIPIVEKLIQAGVNIKAYDPAASKNMKQLYPEIAYCDSAEQALEDSDGAVILTEWNEFKTINWEQVAPTMRHKLIVDMRNIVSAPQLEKLGFTLSGIALRTTLS